MLSTFIKKRNYKYIPNIVKTDLNRIQFENTNKYQINENLKKNRSILNLKLRFNNSSLEYLSKYLIYYFKIKNLK